MSENINCLQVNMYPDGRLDTANASTYLGLSVKTLAMMRSQGTGPRFIKRGRIFYFRDDLDEWASVPKVRSTAEHRSLNTRANSDGDPS